jgi:NAD(P)-dependent dehydrogenase (short-subunit alcohol dehydrogenase family)
LSKKHFHKRSPEVFLNNFTYNILPTIKITQAAIKIFRKKKFGKIITVLTSYLKNKPPVGLSEYVASKSYLRSLSNSWATENIRFNITSNTISPSFMLTSLNSNEDSRIVDNLITSLPLKKLLTVEEVSQCLAFLLTATQQINGQDFLINQGTNL